MSPVAINGVDKQGVDINGVQVKQNLNAANSTVNKGVYDATLLETVDPDLANGNIKNAINIFGKVGTVVPMDVSDADAAVGDVKDPKTFYSVAAPRKTGTMPTVALDPALNAYPAGYHAGAASLTAVDADLAVGNIKSGVTIFGVLGTYTQVATHDIAGIGYTALIANSVGVSMHEYSANILTGADLDLASLTQTYAAGCLAEAYGYALTGPDNNNTLKLRLYMNGTQVAESSWIAGSKYQWIRVNGSAALSGSKIVKIAIHNYDVGTQSCRFLGQATAFDNQPIISEVFCASVKVV